jgi:hypothetical protein
MRFLPPAIAAAGHFLKQAPQPLHFCGSMM